MEKRKPHFSLERVKALIQQGQFRVTRTALGSAKNDFGIRDERQLMSWIILLSHQDFYKSMTTYGDSKVWQDVYRSDVKGIPAYIKIQLVDESTVVISFKRLEN